MSNNLEERERQSFQDYMDLRVSDLVGIMYQQFNDSHSISIRLFCMSIIWITDAHIRSPERVCKKLWQFVASYGLYKNHFRTVETGNQIGHSTTYYKSYLIALPQEQNTQENHEIHLAW